MLRPNILHVVIESLTQIILQLAKIIFWGCLRCKRIYFFMEDYITTNKYIFDFNIIQSSNLLTIWISYKEAPLTV